MPDVYPTPRPITGQRQFSSVIGGYDAVEDRGRRRPPLTRTMHEDEHAKERHRQIISASGRDLVRNWAVASWALRKHLDFISDFSFQAKTSDAGFNKEYEAWWKEQSRKFNFDVAGRHPHRRAARLTEAGRMIDGDSWWLKLAPPFGNPLRGKRQLIEGDRIAMPPGDLPKNSKPEDWVNGCRVDSNTGKTLAVAICRRVGRTRKELQRIVPARNISQHAAFEFRVDQVRGISPITTALNAYRDTMEGFEYSFAKLKIAQLFGLQITSQNDGSGSFTGPGTAQYTADADGDGTADSAPQINLTKGPFVTELNPGEEAKVIESHTPSTETVNFLKLAIHVALRATDIPYSFFDESFTNFYGSRGGLIQYLHSCNAKVQDLQEFLDDDHRWRAGLAVEDGELVLPSGKDFSFLEWEFVPGGIPWWDSTKEVRGAAMSVAAGFSSPIRVCQETGTNFFKNIDETAECLAYAREKEVPLTFGDSTAFAPGITVEASSAN